MTYRLRALLACFVLSLSLSGQSTPPAQPDNSQEAVVYERIKNLIRFEDDGTGTRDTTAAIRIQSQGAVRDFGQLIFGYSSATENLDVDYVRVRKPDGRIIDTPSSTAQDFAPDILREAPMYSDYRQRHISVVGLQMGDVLEYHVVIHVSPLAPNEFWYQHSFPEATVVNDDLLEINLPKTRAVKLKSSKHKFETREEGERKIYSWVIKDHVSDGSLDDDDDEDDYSYADVELSTFTDWQQIAKWYAKLQGERVIADDGVRAKADELTRGATTPTEKARRLYDYVALNIRYVSLSFGVGRYQPHSASDVLQNGYGDCKDKHTLLAAMLRSQGIESYPVLIHSYRKLDTDVPSPAQFDHVITAARLGEDFTWLDSTAEVAPFGVIMYGLRNKQVLIATDDASGGLRKTSADSPIKNLLSVKLDGKFTETGTLDATIDVKASGDNDIPLRAAFRNLAQSNWQLALERLSRIWGLYGDVSDIKLEPVEDTSKPFHLTYKFRQENYFRVPTSGASFQILPEVGRLRMQVGGGKKSTRPIDVGPAEEWNYHARIQFPANYTLHVPNTSVTMKRDYGEFFASYTVDKNVIEAERHMVLKVNELPASRRTDFESFRNLTTNNVNPDLWASITAPSNAALAAATKIEGTPKELRKAGNAALQRNDYATAVELLKRASDQDSMQKDVWDDLGRAYAGMNEHDQAIGAFRKQLEQDPSHGRANSDLAAELQLTGKFDDAVAAYRKQLEIDPSDKFAHKKLGLLLAQLKHDDEARTELETAAALPPDDPELKLALAQVYARTGDTEKSAAIMKSVMGVATPVTGADIFAAALTAADPNPSQSIRDARRTLDDISDQFDSGEYDRVGPSVFSAMNLVALAWSRIGWAKSQQGELLEALQYMNPAWMLSQSGTVASRISTILEKEGQKDKARHMLALAIAAGGQDAQSWRVQMTKLSATPEAANKEIDQATTELLQLQTIKLAAIAPGSARFNLVFDNSTRPDQVEFVEGDASLRGATTQLREKDYPVKFPEVSSIKIVRRGALTCNNSGCAMVLAPGQSMVPNSTEAHAH
jgi:tetratricopeptide (TPR) repeat protein